MDSLVAKKSIAVLIVEDHPLIVFGLQAVVQSMDECRLVGVAATPEEARRIARVARPDVITLDLRMGGHTAAGIQLARDLRTLAPNSHILVCSGFVFEGDVTALVEMGIGGYVTKDEPPTLIATAMRAVADGQTFYSRAVSPIVRRILRQGKTPAQEPFQTDTLLTGRESEILQLVARGLANQEIARQLAISPSAVQKHLTIAYEKLAARNRTDAVIKAHQQGLISVD